MILTTERGFAMVKILKKLKPLPYPKKQIVLMVIVFTVSFVFQARWG